MRVPFRNRIRGRLVIPALLCAVLAEMATDARAVEPWIDWKTIETGHFSIHFYKGEERWAQRTAEIAEKAHELVAGWLGWEPSEKTQILIYDDVDSANGSAWVRPYNAISILITSPGSLSSLNDYDEWLWGLIVHEYAHVIHLDMAYGIPWVVNSVFGKTSTPNQVQPRWFIEGLATYAESYYSGGGRIRSSLFGMYVRTAMIEDAFPEIDRVASGQVWWPQGTTAYLYGSHFIDYIARRFGHEKLAEISKEYASRIIPYSFNKIARKVLGDDYISVYEDWKAEVRDAAVLAVERAGRRPPTQFERITETAQWTHMPRWAPGGRLAWYEGSQDDYPHIVLHDPADGTRRRVTRVNGGGAFSFVPGSDRFVMAQSEVFEQFASYSDLYVSNLGDGDRVRLTRGLRADDPDVSPDGTRVAFVKNGLGLTSLCVLPLSSATPSAFSLQPSAFSCLWSPDDATQISTPRWAPDGSVIAVSAWTPGGERDIYLVNVKSGVPERLTADRAIDAEPDFSRDGRYVFFSSDRTGIFNIFAFDRDTREVFQVSNVLSGAFSPRVSPDGSQLAFVIYGHRGYDVARMPLDRRGWFIADAYEGGRPEPPLPERGPEREVKPYSPWDTIFPRSWFPIWEDDAYGKVYGAVVRGGDIVGRHNFMLAPKYGADSRAFLYEASYTNRSLYPYINLYSARSNYELGGAQFRHGRDAGYREWNTRGTVSASFPFSSWDVDQNVGVEYSYEHLTPAEGTIQRNFMPDESMPSPPDLGDLASVSLSYFISNARGYGMSVSPEEGGAGSVTLRYYSPVLGSAFEVAKVEANGKLFRKLPSMKHHVAAFNLSYGTGTGDMRHRRLFYIGGVPDRDIVKDLMDDVRTGGENLRGYQPYGIAGDTYVIGNVEYRFPLFVIERGLHLLPFYLRRAHGAFFVDVGNAWTGPFESERLRVGSGLELRVDMLLGFYVPATLRTGYAEGFSTGGIKQFYYVLGVVF
ncbi:MAG: PD40 domain-containing protein [Deltaproteobacteria bacterium]|nr:PD40 domain-containing protein [Deltaproteobacteria bacterium]